MSLADGIFIKRPPHDAAPERKVRTTLLAEWPAGTFVENLVARPDGKLLVAVHSTNRLELIDPESPEARSTFAVLPGPSAILFGGPALDALGRPETMILVIEAEDLPAAQRFIQDEPYTANQVFSEVQIRRWAQVMPEPHPGALAEQLALEAAKAKSSDPQ